MSNEPENNPTGPGMLLVLGLLPSLLAGIIVGKISSAQVGVEVTTCGTLAVATIIGIGLNYGQEIMSMMRYLRKLF